MACDRYYLENVKDWFQEDVDVSDVEMVIAVPKGSKTVSVLADPGEARRPCCDWAAGSMYYRCLVAANAGEE